MVSRWLERKAVTDAVRVTEDGHHIDFLSNSLTVLNLKIDRFCLSVIDYDEGAKTLTKSEKTKQEETYMMKCVYNI